MVYKVCWFSWIPSIKEVHVLTETCEIEGRQEDFQKIDSAGEAQDWARNACVESCPNVALKRMCVTQRCHFSAKQIKKDHIHQILKRAPRSCHKIGFWRRRSKGAISTLASFFYMFFSLYCFLLGCWPQQPITVWVQYYLVFILSFSHRCLALFSPKCLTLSQPFWVHVHIAAALWVHA